MLVHTRLEGSQLTGNLLGDPSERDLFVYLPPGYEESDRRYPVAYLLQASGTTAAEMVAPATDGQRWSPPLEDVLEPVFRRMGVAPMIVAIPDGWSRWGCGQWVDSPVTGNFEQYLIHDVVAAVDAGYRTILRREVEVCSGSRREASVRGTWPRATPVFSARWRCSLATRSWT